MVDLKKKQDSIIKILEGTKEEIDQISSIFIVTVDHRGIPDISYVGNTHHLPLASALIQAHFIGWLAEENG